MRIDSNFDEVVAQFQKLLEHEKYSSNIVWVMPEDALLSGERFIYVRLPIPGTNEVKARKIFQEGMANGRGLLISTLCELRDSTCCYLWYPKSKEDEPQGLWPQDGSVKLSVKIEMSRVPGKVIKSRLLWAFIKFRVRRKQGLKDFAFS